MFVTVAAPVGVCVGVMVATAATAVVVSTVAYVVSSTSVDLLRLRKYRTFIKKYTVYFP